MSISFAYSSLCALHRSNVLLLKLKYIYINPKRFRTVVRMDLAPFGDVCLSTNNTHPLVEGVGYSVHHFRWYRGCALCAKKKILPTAHPITPKRSFL